LQDGNLNPNIPCWFLALLAILSWFRSYFQVSNRFLGQVFVAYLLFSGYWPLLELAPFGDSFGIAGPRGLRFFGPLLGPLWYLVFTRGGICPFWVFGF